MKYIQKSTFLLLYFLAGCQDYTTYQMPDVFVSIDILDQGKCSFPLLVTIQDDIFFQEKSFFVYSNPLQGVFGYKEDFTDPPFRTGMVQNCRLYFNTQARLTKIHVLHLVNGKEAHFEGELLPFHLKDIPQCPERIDGTEDGWKHWIACGNATATKVTMTLELEYPETTVDWETLIVDEMMCLEI